MDFYSVLLSMIVLHIEYVSSHSQNVYNQEMEDFKQGLNGSLQDVIKWERHQQESSDIEIANSNDKFAGGIVSVDCLRCMCLYLSDCLPVKCFISKSMRRSCGYFHLSLMFWQDCGQPGPGFQECAEDFMCASKCVQNYMKTYAPPSHCPLTCETFVRIHAGGPSGCSNSQTLKFWQQLQQVPGCKGIR